MWGDRNIKKLTGKWAPAPGDKVHPTTTKSRYMKDLGVESVEWIFDDESEVELQKLNLEFGDEEDEDGIEPC